MTNTPTPADKATMTLNMRREEMDLLESLGLLFGMNKTESVKRAIRIATTLMENQKSGWKVYLVNDLGNRKEVLIP